MDCTAEATWRGDDAPVPQQQSCADRNDSNEMLGDRALAAEKDRAS